MKLNKPYPLYELFMALASAQESHDDVVIRMKKDGVHETQFVRWEIEGMKSFPQFARVVFTRNLKSRVEGFMEETLLGGHTKAVAVVQKLYTMKANEDYTKFEIVA